LAKEVSIKVHDEYEVKYYINSGVTRGDGGRTAPGDTLQGGDTRRKICLWANL